MLSRKLFWSGPISKSKLLNGTETSFGCALISNNCHLFCIKEKIVGRDKKYREGGREGEWGKTVILYKNPSPQNKQKKNKRKKKNDISKKHSKQAIRQGKLRKITKRSTSERSIV